MLSEPALTGGGGFAEAGGGFPLKSRPLLPPPSRSVPGPGPPPPGLAAAERGLPRRTGRTGTSLDRIRGSVMERDRPVLPSGSRVPMDAGSGNRTVTGTGAGDHDRRRRRNGRARAHPEHPPDGRDGSAASDTDGLRRVARLLRDGGAKRAVMEATGRMHRGFRAVTVNPRQCWDLPRPGGAPGRTGRAGAGVPAAPSAAFPDMAATAPADVTAGRLRDMLVLREAPVDRRAEPRRFPPGSESRIRKGRSRGCWRNRTPPSAGTTGGPGGLSGAPGNSPQATRSWPRFRGSARSRRRPRSPGRAGRARPPAARPRRRAAWRRSPATAGRSGAGAT